MKRVARGASLALRVCDANSDKSRTSSLMASRSFINAHNSNNIPLVSAAQSFSTATFTTQSQPKSDHDVVLNLPPKPIVFRTSKTNPVTFDENDVGLFYTLPSDKFNQLFQWGIEARFRNQIKAINESSFMIRRPFLEIKDLIAETNPTQSSRRYLLLGKRGAGKTMTLNTLLHYGSSAGWLIVQMPWALGWFHRMTEGKTEISSWNPRRIDLPLIAADWLRNFKVQNAVLLATRPDLVTTNTYKWTARESTTAGSHLSDLVDFGLERIRYSSDCVGAILKEIRALNNHCTTPVRTLVTLDGINMFWMQTTLTRPDQGPKVYVPAETVSLVHNFKKMLRSDWAGGVVVSSLDADRLAEVWTMNRMSQPYDKNCINPREVLSEKGFAAIEPFYPVHVPYYDKREFLNAMQFYHEKRIIHSPTVMSDQGIKEIEMLTNRNPGYLCDLTRAM